MIKKVTYDPIKHDFIELKKLLDEGTELLCPSCGSKLQVILDKDEAMRLGKNAGVLCPEDATHIQVSYNFGYDDEFWENITK